MTRKGKIPTQHWVRAGVGNPMVGGRAAAVGVCAGKQQFKAHSNTDMDPTKGSDSTETAG